MLLALIVNAIGFLQLLTQTFYTLNKNSVKLSLLEALLVRWILLIIIILLDNICLGIADILPFGTFVYNYYKLMVFVSKNDFHVSMMQKFIVKADPDVLGELFLTVISRVMIRIMHKQCMVIKKLNLPVSQTDFNLSQEIMEFLEEYHPKIIKTSNNLNNTSLMDQSLIDSQNDLDKEKEKRKQEEKKKKLLEKQRKERQIEEEIQRKQEELQRMKQKKLQEMEEQYDESDNSYDNRNKYEEEEDILIPKRDRSDDNKSSPTKSKTATGTKSTTGTKVQQGQRESSQTKDAIKTKSTLKQSTNNEQRSAQPVKKVVKKSQESDEEYDDDIIDNIDFNDSSSKYEDSSNERRYANSKYKSQQNKILSDSLVENDDEEQNFKDADQSKKKEIIGIKRTTSKLAGSTQLPPTSTASTNRQKTTQNAVSTGSNDSYKSTTARGSSNQKDKSFNQSSAYDSNSPTSTHADSSSSSKAGYKSKYVNNGSSLGNSAKSQLDEAKTKFEQYKEKYQNTKQSNISLIDKDD